MGALMAYLPEKIVEKRQYLATLLIYEGTKLLREKFDSIHKPENLTLTLTDPAIKSQLNGILTVEEWYCLYPPDPGKHISSADFDLWLILKLLRTICGLTPPVTGWYNMPHGVTFAEDLARIECYCDSVRDKNMTDARFNYLWTAISEAFLRIAAGISSEKEREEETSIGELLQDPLRSPAVVDKYVDNLRSWRNRRENEFLRIFSHGKRVSIIPRRFLELFQFSCR